MVERGGGEAVAGDGGEVGMVFERLECMTLGDGAVLAWLCHAPLGKAWGEESHGVRSLREISVLG